MTRRPLTIGEAAHAVGVTRKALRVYELKGLLPPAARTEAGYRVYEQADLEVLRFIGRARALGLHLNDIREILNLRKAGSSPCGRTRALIDTRIEEIDSTVADLLAMRSVLVDARGRADVVAGGQDDVTVCPIIERS